MDSQAGVQNFSLPNRSNSRRPFSPVPPFANHEHNRSCSHIASNNNANNNINNNNNTNMATVNSALQSDAYVDGSDDTIDRIHVRSPTPTALQLFHFTEDAATSKNRRSSRVLPRPMSTSSSAPALGGTEHDTPVIVVSNPNLDDRPGPCSPIGARRERLIFWTLVATALIGVLSCTAAVTLAAAQAALQAGLDDVEGVGGGIIWDSRTLGWLIASLIVCASAAVGLVVATSARCRRSRRLNRRRSRTPTPPSASPSQTAAREDKPASKEKKEATGKTTNRMSALFSSRHEDGTKKGAWVEMQEMGTKRESVTEDVPKWWHFGKVQRYGDVTQDSPKASPNGSRNSSSKQPASNRAGSSGDGTMDLPDEDRNWAKFSQDPAQLRRYVESLEARLAGSQDPPVSKPSKVDSAVTETETGNNISPKRIRIRPSTSVRTVGTAKTETTTATTATIQPVMGSAGPSAPHSAYSLLLPPGSPASVVSASVVSSSSPRRPRKSSANGLSVGRDLTNPPPPPMPSHTASLPASDTQASILGQLYSPYSERERV
ncbi:tor pathway phosphatidylinositol 3-kinase [Ophiostoma piceae UAMH 11346]|uniref:Tor pathway phosphatidylinositol 3-kinase n=1 Tax=Ophiostoma piceae (strain UAMH 11346) TaxID=1262450 RepID=S3BTT1_OPHP1|nr:tor pathway phosphatidylinositol 3-kinase [Ophiostoma piceae UAMH 11346]